jgi:hypothetical protein
VRTTILNLDCSTISVISWQKGLTLLLLGKIQPIEFWDRPILSAGGEYFRVPKTVMVKKYVKLSRRNSPTKRNVFLRDDYTCQYCGANDVKMTIDHVFPKSRGGRESWENLVASCVVCNNRKGDRTPEEAKMMLKRKPYKPS